MDPLIPVDDAIDRLVSMAVAIDEVETVTIGECVGRALAGDVLAEVDVPPAPNSSMDGYALNATDSAITPGASLLVSDRIAAGQVGRPLLPGTIARIFTGAPIPEGADAVVIQEDTTAAADNRVILNVVPAAGDNVRPAGQDIARGTTLFRRGRRIRPQDAAVMASVGTDRVTVYRTLRIAVMSTGDELVDPPGPIAPGQIFNSNHYALRGLIAQAGMKVVDLGLVGDSREATEAALKEGAASADCIISSGGVSVGEEDHVKAALEKLGKLDLWRIAIKPGKPLAFGSVNGTPFFGLPGNPVSTFVTFVMIARPYLRKLQGLTELLPTPMYGRAAFEMKPGARREYLRVRTTLDDDGEIYVEQFGQQGSGVMSSVSWANAFAEIDVGQAVSRGDRVKIYSLEDLTWG